MADMNDDEIITGLLKGGPAEEKALRWMYRNNLPMVIAHILENNGSQQDAEDVFQETVLTFRDQVVAGTFLRRAKISTFLMSIVRRKWYNRLRRSGYNEGYVAEMKHLLEADQESIPDMADPVLMDEELIQKIDQLVLKIGEKCREVLRMRFWDQFSMEKIAEKLGYKNAQIAKNKHFRCIEELRALLDNDPDLRNTLRDLL